MNSDNILKLKNQIKTKEITSSLEEFTTAGPVMRFCSFTTFITFQIIKKRERENLDFYVK